MDIPFRVVFIETYGEKEHIIECEHFSAQLENRDLLNEVVLTENSMLRIYFEAPAGYKLYIDGLDQLEEHFIHEDENGVYIRPGKTAYTLYNPFDHKKSYPFIPGNYRLLLQTQEASSFEANMRVKTKRITSNQHSVMIEEIEGTVKALSNGSSEKWGNRFETALQLFGSEQLKVYEAVLFNKEKLMNSLYEIEKNRKYTIQIEPYPMSAAVSTITYEVAENRWLKTVLHAILRVVNEMRLSFHRLDLTRLNEQQVKDIRHEVLTLHNRLTSFVNLHWIRPLKSHVGGMSRTSFYANGPYAIFHNVYESIHRKSFEQAAVAFQFHHKPSNVLYELWGYLKIIERLQKGLGFQIKRNNLHFEKNGLLRNTDYVNFIELEKGACTLRVFYGAEIPNRKEVLSQYETMFTMSHNTPDCRIDVWNDGQFKGALIIDFKYRKKEYLWNDHALAYGKPSRVMRQLSAYSTSIKSDTHILNGEKNLLTDAQPVREVWAVYPVKYEHFDVNYEKNDYSIRFVDLSPGADHGHFELLLEKSMDQIIAR